MGNQIVSATPGASALVIDGQTLSLGGPAITLSDDNAVASLGPSGLVVQYSDGSVSSFALPTSTTLADPTPLATIGNQIFSANPAASIIVVAGQTFNLASPATPPESNMIASVKTSEPVEYLGSGVSLFALSTLSPQAVASDIVGTVDGYVVATFSSGNALVVGSQTLSIGGPVATLGNDDVMSLGSSGIVIEEPGGEVTTFAIPTLAVTRNSATLTWSSGIISANASGKWASIPK
jgi:hypothetical protein